MPLSSSKLRKKLANLLGHYVSVHFLPNGGSCLIQPGGELISGLIEQDASGVYFLRGADSGEYPFVSEFWKIQSVTATSSSSSSSSASASSDSTDRDDGLPEVDSQTRLRTSKVEAEVETLKAEACKIFSDLSVKAAYLNDQQQQQQHAVQSSMRNFREVMEQAIQGVDSARMADSAAVQNQMSAMVTSMQSIEQAVAGGHMSQAGAVPHVITLCELLESEEWPQLVLIVEDVAIQTALVNRFGCLINNSNKHTAVESSFLVEQLVRLAPFLRKAIKEQIGWVTQAALHEVDKVMWRLHTMYFGVWFTDHKTHTIGPMDMFSDNVQMDQLPVRLRKKWEETATRLKREPEPKKSQQQQQQPYQPQYKQQNQQQQYQYHQYQQQQQQQQQTQPQQQQYNQQYGGGGKKGGFRSGKGKKGGQ